MTHPELKPSRKGDGNCTGHTKGAFLPDETRPVQVRLRSRDPQKLIGFYHELLGLHLVEGKDGEIGFAGNRGSNPFVVLHEDKHLIRSERLVTGLFHLAIRFPNRRALARTCVRLLGSPYAMDGASDHLVSEAIYLTDPEGNGVELYADRPASEWVWRDGKVAMGTQPLDLDELVAANGRGPERGESLRGPELGHIHLRTANLELAEKFYRDFLGLAVTNRAYPGALFFSAGGYHHHIAVNTWGSPALAQPASVALMSYRFAVPCAEIHYCLRHRAPLVGVITESLTGAQGSELTRLQDPNGNWLEVISS